MSFSGIGGKPAAAEGAPGACHHLQGLSPTTESNPDATAALRRARLAMLDAYLISIASLASSLGMAAVFLWVYGR